MNPKAFANAVSFLVAHEDKLDRGLSVNREYLRSYRAALRTVCVGVGVKPDSLAAELLAEFPYFGDETPETLKARLGANGVAVS